MNVIHKTDAGVIAVASFILGMSFIIAVTSTKVERIQSPPGLIVITPEGKKVFVPETAITQDGSSK